MLPRLRLRQEREELKKQGRTWTVVADSQNSAGCSNQSSASSSSYQNFSPLLRAAIEIDIDERAEADNPDMFVEVDVDGDDDISSDDGKIVQSRSVSVEQEEGPDGEGREGDGDIDVKAETKTALRPRPLKPCVICSDKSSGYHYGICACEGCKGFFRRSILKNLHYCCHKERRCEVNRKTRNRCQYCRLMKCFAKGMNKEALRVEKNKRKLKVAQEKQRLEEERQRRLEAQKIPEMCEEKEVLIQAITDAHRETYPVVSHATTPQKPEVDPVPFIWNYVPDLSPIGVNRIVEFAKHIPGFSQLSEVDQIVLLKACSLEIILLRLSLRYDGSDCMAFTDTVTLTQQQLRDGGLGAVADTIFNFGSSLHRMEIDSAEIALLSAICVLSSDRTGLQAFEQVEALQEPIIEAMKYYVQRNRPSQPTAFAKLLMKLTDLRSISVKSAEKVLYFHKSHAEQQRIPEIVAEILDREENVCLP